MANFLKISLFLIVVAGIAVYFSTHWSEIFHGISFEKIFPPLSKYPAPSKSSPSTSLKKTITPENPTISNNLIPKDFTREQISPYFNKIKISSVSFYSADNPLFTIQLYSNLEKEEKINITGWRIKSNQGEIVIPQAVNVYEPLGASPSQNIILSKNSNVINLYSNQSPINKNLRLNKCIGYLQNNYFFEPALPQACPSISRLEMSSFSSQCQNYIQSLPACKIPERSFYDSLSFVGEDLACRKFLDTLNYQGCFQKHHLDSDFLFNEWWIWLNFGAQNFLNRQHDRLLLFDNQGLLVDEYSY